MLTLLLALATTCSQAASAVAASMPDAGLDAATIELGIGTQKVIDIDRVASVQTSTPAVADIKTLDRGLLVVGSADGVTAVTVARRGRAPLHFLIHVRKSTPCEEISPERKFLGDREGITIRRTGDHLYLAGQAYSQDDWERVQEMQQAFPEIRSFVRLSPSAVRKAVVEANAELARAGLACFHAELLGHSVVREGTPLDRGDDAKADAILAPVRKLASEL